MMRAPVRYRQRTRPSSSARDSGHLRERCSLPRRTGSKVDVQDMRGWKMAQVFYAPFAYNPVEKQVFRLSGSAIEVTFETTSLKSSLGRRGPDQRGYSPGHDRQFRRDVRGVRRLRGIGRYRAVCDHHYQRYSDCLDGADVISWPARKPAASRCRW